MTLKSVWFATAVMACLVTAAHAEVIEITGVSGKVLLNQGEGFVHLSGPALLTPGNTIMLGTDGTAEIHFTQAQCVVSLAATSVMTIPESAPCFGGQSVGLANGLFAQPAAGVFKGGFVVAEGLSVAQAAAMVAGFLALGVIGYTVVLDPEDEPVSTLAY